MELSEGYLDTVPDCCSFKTEVLYLGNDTTLLAVKALAEFMKKRPGQLLFSVLSLRLDEKTDPDIFPALLDVLQEYTVSQNATVVLRVDDLGGSGLLADPNGHDSVKRIVQDHTSTVVFSCPGKSSAPIDIFDGPFRRLQKIHVSDLDHPTEHMMSWILSMVKRVDGDDTNTDSLSQPPATTTDHSPNRLRLISFYKCQMYDVQWIQLLKSIDILTLEELSIVKCHWITNSNLTALVDRCISIVAEVSSHSQERSSTLSTDPWALRDLRHREHHPLLVNINGTSVTNEHFKIEVERLRKNKIEWLRFDY